MAETGYKPVPHDAAFSKALLWQKIRALLRVLPKSAG
jgi:hypothetical protein